MIKRPTSSEGKYLCKKKNNMCEYKEVNYEHMRALWAPFAQAIIICNIKIFTEYKNINSIE